MQSEAAPGAAVGSPPPLSMPGGSPERPEESSFETASPVRNSSDGVLTQPPVMHDVFAQDPTLVHASSPTFAQRPSPSFAKPLVIPPREASLTGVIRRVARASSRQLAAITNKLSRGISSLGAFAWQFVLDLSNDWMLERCAEFNTIRICCCTRCTWSSC